MTWPKKQKKKRIRRKNERDTKKKRMTHLSQPRFRIVPSKPEIPWLALSSHKPKHADWLKWALIMHEWSTHLVPPTRMCHTLWYLLLKYSLICIWIDYYYVPLTCNTQLEVLQWTNCTDISTSIIRVVNVLTKMVMQCTLLVCWLSMDSDSNNPVPKDISPSEDGYIKCKDHHGIGLFTDFKKSPKEDFKRKPQTA